MRRVAGWIEGLSWKYVVLACLTLGLAPFIPMPHVVEKLVWLGEHRLSRPIDIFDLGFHGLPWVVLVVKAGLIAYSRFSHSDARDDDTSAHK